MPLLLFPIQERKKEKCGGWDGGGGRGRGGRMGGDTLQGQLYVTVGTYRNISLNKMSDYAPKSRRDGKVF